MDDRIYYLNKSWDASGFGHAAVMIPAAGAGYRYYSFFATRKVVPVCAGTLLVKEFKTAEEGLSYAKTEGYTREAHWALDAAKAADARAAVEGFATGSTWNLFSRNCWDAVRAALRAAGVDVHRARRWPNWHFARSKPHAEGWSNL